MTTTSPNEIKTMVQVIRTWREKDPNLSFDQIKNKFLTFYEKYPKLVEAAWNPAFPMEFLDAMLEQVSKLNECAITMEEADTEIYGKLREKYIDPVFPEGYGVEEAPTGVPL